ncbi:MAG: recombinase family protein [Clostridia bacterium]|nr:recombinase family protein [Clostridia bacterium]MBQ4610372.1 recombinase family protein [Clostridia bacterium]MBR2156289.1 recombinase family protein [Clostridia bacterium]MBR2329194.1 recombinase family protein [Clostridia bacterium]MBR4019215.1 recombinase family protein [Clostridia bacterium]
MTTQKVYGYIRVSTKEQNEDRQYIAMLEFGVKNRDIYMDKQSGKDFNRPAYKRVLRLLKPGDVLVVKSIDRLGRNYEEIIEQWRMITKIIGAAIVVLDMPLLDTRQKDKDLTGTFISDLVLQILSYVAQTEREFMRQRQAEGIAAARAKGVRFGRPPMPKPPAFEMFRREWVNNEISAREAARCLGIDHKTFITWANQAAEAEKVCG